MHTISSTSYYTERWKCNTWKGQKSFDYHSNQICTPLIRKNSYLVPSLITGQCEWALIFKSFLWHQFLKTVGHHTFCFSKEYTNKFSITGCMHSIIQAFLKSCLTSGSHIWHNCACLSWQVWVSLTHYNHMHLYLSGLWGLYQQSTMLLLTTLPFTQVPWPRSWSPCLLWLEGSITSHCIRAWVWVRTRWYLNQCEQISRSLLLAPGFHQPLLQCSVHQSPHYLQRTMPSKNHLMPILPHRSWHKILPSIQVPKAGVCQTSCPLLLIPLGPFQPWTLLVHCQFPQAATVLPSPHLPTVQLHATTQSRETPFVLMGSSVRQLLARAGLK